MIFGNKPQFMESVALYTKILFTHNFGKYTHYSRWGLDTCTIESATILHIQDLPRNIKSSVRSDISNVYHYQN